MDFEKIKEIMNLFYILMTIVTLCAIVITYFLVKYEFSCKKFQDKSTEMDKQINLLMENLTVVNKDRDRLIDSLTQERNNIQILKNILATKNKEIEQLKDPQSSVKENEKV